MEIQRISYVKRLVRVLLEMNWFETNDRSEQIVHIQRWSTRIYFSIFMITMIGLLTQTGLEIHNNLLEIKKPTLNAYLELQKRYSDVSCPCSQISMSYNSFITMVPVYHPICSSGFISEVWINTLIDSMTPMRYPADFRAIASTQFQVLRALCNFSQMFVRNKIRSFSDKQFISKSLVNENQWKVEIDAAVRLFIDSTLTNGKHRVLFLRSFITFNLLGSSIQTPTTLLIEREDNEIVVRSTRNLFPPMFNQYYCACDDGDICYASSGLYERDQIDNQGHILDQLLSLVPLFSLKNWFVGCWAIQSVLRSSFNDSFLSDQGALDELLAYLNWPSDIVQSISLISEASSNFPMTGSTISHLLENLFVKDLQIEKSYSNYFEQCQPHSCYFTRKQRSSILYMITALLALYGGLSVILRFTIPHSVTIIVKRLNRRNQMPPNINTARENKPSMNVKTVLGDKRTLLLELNLFKSPNRQEASDIRQQRLTTRLYILCLLVGVLILTFYTVLNVQKKTIFVSNPTLERVLDLQSQSSINSSLDCPCKQISVAYDQLVQIKPIYHQVCSSEFVVYSKWLYYIRALLSVNRDLPLHELDFRRSYQSFHLLSSICDLINRTFENSLENFEESELVTSTLLSVELFESRINSSIKIFKFDFMNTFLSFFRLTRNVTYVNQYLNDGNMGSFRVTNSRTATFSIDGFSGIRNEQFYSCSCANDISCKGQMGLYDRVYVDTPYKLVPGMYRACFQIESMVQSTLECFYDDTDCFTNSTGFYQQTWFPTNFTLLNSSLPSRFMKNSTIGSILSELMIEYWLQSLNYSSYFDSCQPLSCSYNVFKRNTLLESITIVLGLFGGLSVTLRILIPTMVEVYFIGIQRQSNTPAAVNNQPLRLILLGLVARVRNRLTQINTFESETKRTVKDIQEQQHATILYYVLFAIALYFLLVYNALTATTETITVRNPTLKQYEQFEQIYNADAVNCPCSQVSIISSSFIDYQCSIHPICSSEFLSDGFLQNLFEIYRSLNPQEATMNAFTLKGTIFASLQALQLLCNLTTDAMLDVREQYLSSSIIFAAIISRNTFYKQINKSLTEFELTMPDEFLTNLQFVRSIMQGNAFVSLYSSNYYPIIYNWIYYGTVYMIPQNYNNCSCLASALCRQPSNPYISGYLIGCTPFESILQSTLECFYQQSCMNQLATSLNLSLTIPKQLDVNNTRFEFNATIEKILEKLFINKCSSKISYENFFDQCHPLSCIIILTRNENILTIVSLIFALYGGLSTSLRLIVPLFVFTIYKIIRKRQTTISIHVKPSEEK